MATFTVELEGMAELAGKWASECAHLEGELQVASWSAASDGVSAARANHPYTDRTYNLTNTARPEVTEDGEADMVWPMTYASYVDEGTSRSRPYPFMPQAKVAAAASLEERTAAAVAHTEGRMK